MDAGNAHEDAVNGDPRGEEPIGELKLDTDVLNPSPGDYDTELEIIEEYNGGGNPDVVTPVGSVSSGEGLGTPARADSIPNDHEMSVDDEITMETTDPITEEDPPSIASEIESVVRDAKRDVKFHSAGGDDSRETYPMDTRRGVSSFGGSNRPRSPINNVMSSYLNRERDTEYRELYLDIPDIPDIEVDSDSEEYELQYENGSESDRGVNDILSALQDQINWKSDYNLRRARNTEEEPRNNVIRRYNPHYDPPPEYNASKPSTLPRHVPSSHESKYPRRSSIDSGTRDLASRYLAPLSKKLSTSYDSLPRYQPSSTTSSSSSGYSSVGRYGSVDSLSPSRVYRSQSDEPSYLSKPYSSGLGYRSYSSSDLNRYTPSYRSKYTDTHDYDVDDDDESESEEEKPYYSPLAPYKAYRAYREGHKVKGPFSRHMNRFTTTTSSTTPRSPSTSRKNDTPIDERLRLIRENYRKSHKLDYERNYPSTCSSYAGLAVDSEGGSPLSM